jgi:hypothetical protein
MWIATHSGASFVSTVMPPTTACSTTPKNSVQDSFTSTGRRGRWNIAARIAAPIAAVTA